MRISLKKAAIVLGLLWPGVVAAEDLLKDVGGPPWVVQGLMGLVITLVALTYRNLKADYEKHKTRSETRLEEQQKILEKFVNKEDHRTAILTMTQQMEGFRIEVMRWRNEDSLSVKSVMQDISADLKEQRAEAHRISEEVWRQIDTQGQRMNDFDLALARNYYSKEEFVKMLDQRFEPVLRLLERIAPAADYNGPRRRQTDIRPEDQ